MAIRTESKVVSYLLVLFGQILWVSSSFIPNDDEPCFGNSCVSSKVYIPISHPNEYNELTPTQYALLISMCLVIVGIALAMKYFCWRKAQQLKLLSEETIANRIAAAHRRRHDAESANNIRNSSNWRTQNVRRLQEESIVDRVNNQTELPPYETLAHSTVIDLPPPYDEALKSNTPKT